MYQTQVQYIIALLMLADAGMVLAAGLLTEAFCRFMGSPLEPFPPSSSTGIAVYMMLVCSFFMLKSGLYSERRPTSFPLSMLRIAIAVALSMAVLGLTLYLIQFQRLPNLSLFSYALFLFLLLSANRAVLDFVLTHLLKNRFHSRRVLLVGWDQKADVLVKKIIHQRSWGHTLLGFLCASQDTPAVIYGLPRLGALDDLERILTEQVVDDVFFALPNCSIPLGTYLEQCERHGVSYHIVPAMYDPGSPHQIRAGTLQDMPVLSKTMLHFNPSGYIYKRLMDYIGGIVGTFLFLAMYPAIALAIRGDSPGPVIFKQTRVGRHGRLFTMYKFRTMRADAEADKQHLLAENKMTGAMFKMDNDPRVTRVGRFLRRTSLDEFPQFINVLRGEMSLVGPRPPTPDEVACYLPHHHRKLSVRPGISGLWQISGRNQVTEFNKALEMDLMYIDDWRLRKDLLILLRTVITVLRGEGAV